MFDREIVETLVYVSIAISLVVVVLAAVTSHKLGNLLELRHADTWRSLGEPRLGIMSSENSKKLREFVKNQEYFQLNDAEVSSVARRLNRLGNAGVFIFSVVASLILYLSFTA